MTKCDIIIQNVGMRELLEKYGMFPNRNGKYICCMHADTNPSGSVSRDNRWYRCYACSTFVNTIDFVSKYEHCTRKQAIAKLDEMFKLGLGSNLTKEQKNELQLAQQKAQKEKLKKESERKLEHEARQIVFNKLELWRQIQTACHPTKGDIRHDNWELQDLFIHSLRQQDWLTWLYYKIADLPQKECEFDYWQCATKSKTELAKIVVDGDLLQIF